MELRYMIHGTINQQREQCTKDYRNTQVRMTLVNAVRDVAIIRGRLITQMLEQSNWLLLSMIDQ